MNYTYICYFDFICYMLCCWCDVGVCVVYENSGDESVGNIMFVQGRRGDSEKKTEFYAVGMSWQDSCSVIQW